MTLSRDNGAGLAFARFVVHHPRAIVVFFGLLTLVSAMQLRGLRLETDVRHLLHHDHPAVLEDAHISERFPLEGMIFVSVMPHHPDPEAGAPSIPMLLFANRLMLEIAREPCLRSARHLGLATLVPAASSGFEIDMNDLRHSELLTGMLISHDGRSVGMYFALSDQTPVREVIPELRTLVARHTEGTAYRGLVTGAPIVETSLTEHILRELAGTMPLVMVIVAVLLWFFLGSVRVTLVALTGALVSVILTAALMVAWDTPIYLPTTILPVILIAFGVCDEIHMVHAYRRLRAANPEEAAEEVMAKTIRNLFLPVTITSATTALAFFSFALGEIHALRVFGILAGLGIFITMFVSLMCAPAAWLLFGVGPARDDASRLLKRIIAALPHLPRRWLLPGLALIAVVLVWAGGVGVQDSWKGNFAPDSQIAEEHRLVNDHFGGTHRLTVQLEHAEQGAFSDTGHLSRLASLERTMAGREEVGATLTASAVIAEMEYLAGRNRRIPAHSDEIIAAFESLQSDSGRFLRQITLSEDRRAAAMHLFLNHADYQRIGRVMTLVRQRAGELWAESPVHLRFGGDAAISHALVEEIVAHQIWSLSTAIVLVLLIARLLFRTWARALVTTIPAIVTVVLVAVPMALLDIPLGIATSMIGAVVVGVGCDYALHFMTRFLEATGPREQRIRTAIEERGPAILINAIVVGCGVLALMVSPSPAVRHLGWLTGLALIGASMLTLRLLPMLLARPNPPDRGPVQARNEDEFL